MPGPRLHIRGHFWVGCGPDMSGPYRAMDLFDGHKLCALIMAQRAALSFSVIFMLRQFGS